MRISSPGSNVSERSTLLTPALAFSTNTRPAGSAPRNSASAPRAASSARGSRRAMKCTGWRSMVARQRACAASTTRGVAPNEPWLRKATFSSSANSARAARPNRLLKSGRSSRADAAGG